jgi:hypothetical protein
MQIPLIHQQILLQLEKLREIHRNLMLHNTPVPSADIENLLSEIRKLYSEALELNNENSLQLMNEIQLASEKRVEEKRHETEKIPDVTSNHQAIPEIPKAFVAEEIKPAASVDEETIAKERRNVLAGVQRMFHETPTIGNSFSDHTTFADKIASGEGKKTLSESLKSPVKDMKSAIGLNEKFRFINQLFKGDSKKYNTVIDQLNSSDSESGAMELVKKISDEYDWESNASSAKLFIDFVERRFSA